MKDKVEQRERTEEIVGGARTFNEFVKEKALASNITPACVRSLPEIKEEWKQLKAKEKAEKKAEKTATREAKKAEKKAEKEAKKATAKSDTAVSKEKSAIKKVAKKSAVDAENIKMVLVEKAHKVSKAEKPPQEPKSKGRPKKYATPEEARRAKIEATKILNKAKKAQQPPKPPKPQKQGKKPKEPEVTAETIRRENEEEARRVAKQRKAYNREMRRRGEVEKMGMEDDDAGEKWHPLVHEIELKAYKAKTIKEIDDVLRLIKKATQPSVYSTLDPVNIKSLNHSLNVYSRKRMAFVEHQRQAQENIAMFKNAKANRRVNLEEGEIYEGRGLKTEDLKEFKNYDKIQEHLGQHLNDLKEAIDPKDLRDYIHFTKEKARLKSKLVGGLVRMIGGEMSSDSDSESDSDMEGGGDFFGNIGKAIKTSWDRPVQSKAERDVLDFTLNTAQPALLAPLNILAPPVGKLGDAQRKLLKSKYNV